MKNTVAIIFIVFVHTLVSAQNSPTIEWQRSFGGGKNDNAKCIQQTSDSGYIIAGYSSSNDGDVSGNHGNNSDYWIVKIDATKNIQWQKSFGGTGREEANSIMQTTDGGYIIDGFCSLNDGDVIGAHGGYDYWILKLNSLGNIEWQKTLGGTELEEPSNIEQTNDKGYIIAGSAGSYNGDVVGNHGDGITIFSADAWIIKLDSLGNTQWKKCFGGSGREEATCIHQTLDGGYIFVGSAESNDGDVSGNHGYSDCWVVKLDVAGNIQWQKCFGGTDYDFGKSIIQTNDGGYLFAGMVLSNDGDMSGNHGTYDNWVVKVDSIGNIEWQKLLGGSDYDYPNNIQKTTDLGYVVFGTTLSNDGDVSGNHMGNTFPEDFWVIKFASSGAIEWQKVLGGVGKEHGYWVQQTSDGSYILAGHNDINGGDVSGNHGNWDFWILKICNAVSVCPGIIAKTFSTVAYNDVQFYQWQVATSSGSGFTNLSNSSNYSGVNTSTLTITSPQTSWYGNKYRCIVTTSSETIITDPVILKFNVTWTGSHDNNWFNAANWNCNTLPDSNTDVIIPVGLINYPQVSANTSIRSLMLSSFSNITILPGVVLTITGL